MKYLSRGRRVRQAAVDGEGRREGAGRAELSKVAVLGTTDVIQATGGGGKTAACLPWPTACFPIMPWLAAPRHPWIPFASSCRTDRRRGSAGRKRRSADVPVVRLRKEQAPYDGVWASSQKACRDEDGVERMIIEGDRFYWYETRCRARDIKKVNGKSWTMRMSCEGEGERFMQPRLALAAPTGWSSRIAAGRPGETRRLCALQELAR